MGYSNSEVAHRFAHSIGERCTGSHMFFEGDTIYSYGYHFPMAIKWNGYVLYNDDRYSTSTSKHQSYVFGACCHMDIVHCATLTAEPGSEYFVAKNFKSWREEIEYLTKKMALSRKPEKWLSDIHGIVGRVARFCEVFGLALPDFALNFDDPEKLESVREYELSVQKENREREKKRQEEAIQRFQEFRSNWVRLDYEIVRYREDKNRFETSKGVEVPYEIGKRFYESLRDGTLKAGDQVLYYRVNSVGEKIRIGCHTFKKSYLLKYGKQMFNQ